MEELVKGRVKFFNVNKGFGFIERFDGNKDVFIGSRFSRWQYEQKSLPEAGDIILFEVRQGRKGPEADEWRLELTWLNHQIKEYINSLLDRVRKLNDPVLAEADKLNHLLLQEKFPTIITVRKAFEKAIQDGKLKIGDEVPDDDLMIDLDQEAAKKVRNQFPEKIPVLGKMIEVSYPRYKGCPTSIEITGDLALRWNELPDQGIELPDGTQVKISVKHTDFQVFNEGVPELKERIKAQLENQVRKTLMAERMPTVKLTLETQALPEIVEKTGISPVDGKKISVWQAVIFNFDEASEDDIDGYDFKWKFFAKKMEAILAFEEACDYFSIFLMHEKRRIEKRAHRKRILEDCKKIEWKKLFDNFQLPDVQQIRDGWAAVTCHGGSFSMKCYPTAEEAKTVLDKARTEVDKVRVNSEGTPVYNEAIPLREKLCNLNWNRKEELFFIVKMEKNKKYWKYNLPEYSPVCEYPKIFDDIDKLLGEFKEFKQSDGSQDYVTTEAREIRAWISKAENLLVEFERLVNERNQHKTKAEKTLLELQAVINEKRNSPDRKFCLGEIEKAVKSLSEAKTFCEWHQYSKAITILSAKQ